jgi:hypothetical protein
LYKVTEPLLEAMYAEFKEFSRKKPDGAVSKAKIKVVNRRLEKCRTVLQDELFIEYLNPPDEDDVPQNSDVVLMLSQYVAAMKQFRSSYYRRDGGIDYRWAIEDGDEDDEDYDYNDDDDDDDDET